MAWIVLVISALFEPVWAAALAAADGLRNPQALVVFAVGLCISMGGLAWAMRSLPMGTAYAVWVGIGAAGAVGYSVLSGQEPLSALKLLFLAMIIGGVIGLKVSS